MNGQQTFKDSILNIFLSLVPVYIIAEFIKYCKYFDIIIITIMIKLHIVTLHVPLAVFNSLNHRLSIVILLFFSWKIFRKSKRLSEVNTICIRDTKTYWSDECKK